VAFINKEVVLTFLLAGYVCVQSLALRGGKVSQWLAGGRVAWSGQPVQTHISALASRTVCLRAAARVAGAYGDAAGDCAVDVPELAGDRRRILAGSGGVSMSERVGYLREAVEALHKCKARHEQSVPVVEMFGKETVWEGVVECFQITGHPKAKRCYAWSYPDGKETRYLTVSEIPPVESPQTAVRAAIASKAQK
jgi:hypothetical protein